MNSGYNFYARLLGFRKDCSQILTEISKKAPAASDKAC